MRTPAVVIECPNCHTSIRIPSFRKLERQAEKDFNIAEITAQEKYDELWTWLQTVSLFRLIRFWFNRK